MKKLFIWLIVVVFAVSVAFIGISCKEEVASAEEEEVAEEEIAAGKEVKEEIIEEEQIKIVFWSKWTSEEAVGQVLQSLLNQYMEDNPNVVIETNFVGREIQVSLMSAIQAGNPPDIYDEDPPIINESLGKEGLAVDLTPYLENEVGWNEDNKMIDLFSPGFFEPWTYNGEITCLSYMHYITLFWYDKTMFNKLGITEEDIPNTWSEFLSLCESLKGMGVPPLIQDGGIDFYNFYYWSYLCDRFEGPGALREAIYDKSGASWDKPGFLEAAKKVKELVDDGYFVEGFEGYQWPAGQIDWAQGNGAMILCHNYLPVEVADAVPEDFVFGAFPFPTIEGGKGERFDLSSYPQGAGILKSSKYPDVCFDILKRTISVEWQTEFANVANSIPTRATGVELPEMFSDLEYILANQTASFADYCTGPGQFEPELASMVMFPLDDKLIFGKITPEEFISEIKAKSIAYWEGKEE